MKLIKGSNPEYGEKWVNFAPSFDWTKGPLFGYDLETTSVNPELARIVQAGIVLDIPGKEPFTYDWLVNPEIEIPLNATAIHGINTQAVQEKGILIPRAIIEIMAVLTNLKKTYPDSPLICVNAPYDLTITDREMRRHIGFGISLDRLPPIVDTLTCDRKLDPFRTGRRTLTAASAAYGIPINGAHQAVNDVICSIKLIRAMGKKYPEFATCDLGTLQAMQIVAHHEWADGFEEYKRMENPEFMIERGWPYKRYDNNG